MFLRYQCGCIGFGNNEMKDLFVIAPCNRDDEEVFQIHVSSQLSEKKGEKLSGYSVHRLLRNLGALVHDGYKYQEIKRLLS